MWQLYWGIQPAAARTEKIIYSNKITRVHDKKKTISIKSVNRIVLPMVNQTYSQQNYKRIKSNLKFHEMCNNLCEMRKAMGLGVLWLRNINEPMSCLQSNQVNLTCRNDYFCFFFLLLSIGILLEAINFHIIVRRLVSMKIERML